MTFLMSRVHFWSKYLLKKEFLEIGLVFPCFLKEYGLSHNDFHQGNVMIEWDNSKRDFILYIIDFWEVKIDRMKNKIKMQE
jgi:predicted unusual protein kinase regulating ubiquinone biosynthesis (AarF/ABC1/UbiB family)